MFRIINPAVIGGAIAAAVFFGVTVGSGIEYLARASTT
jgi:hypothetical protein